MTQPHAADHDGARPPTGRAPVVGVRLGVDVGSVRVGVAASDGSGVLAHPVRTLPRDVQGGSDLAALTALVEELEAVEVIVGLPRLMSGQEGEAATIAREYALALARRVQPRTVRLVDERLTTVAAHRRLRDSGVPGRGQRAVIDQAAAVLILQSALDAQSASGRAAGELVRVSVEPGGPRKPRKKDRHR